MVAKPFIYTTIFILGCYSCHLTGSNGSDLDCESVFKRSCLPCHAIINPSNSQGGITFKSIFGNSDSISLKLEIVKLSHRDFNLKEEVLDTLKQQCYPR